MPKRHPVPKVSVCIVTYNHERYIQQALDSVLMQQVNFAYEIVVGEDCSTDNTRKIVELYQRKYPSIVFANLNSNNLGPAENGRRTLQLCRGAYTALLDGDDYWTDPLKLQKQVDLLEKNESVSATFHDTLRLKDGEYQKLRNHDRNIYCLDDVIAEICLCHTSSLVFRRSAIGSLPYWFDRIPSADMIFLMLIAEKGSLQRIPEVMSVYRKHDKGISTDLTRYHTSLHTQRLYMHLCFQKYLNGQAAKKSRAVIWHHAHAIFKGAQPPVARIKRLLESLQTEPRILQFPWGWRALLRGFCD